jgi:hypothetical protein
MTSIWLVLFLAAYVHVDFHLARPATHHWSFGWPLHWIACAVVFGLAAFYIERRWPEQRWTAAVWNIGLALVIGQGIEPLGESLYFDGRFDYPVGAVRWRIFGECMGAALPVVLMVLEIPSRFRQGTTR